MIHVVFDMDGVLVDSELHWKDVEFEFLRVLVPSWTPACQERIIGMSLVRVHEILMAEHGLTVSKEELLAYYQPQAKEIYQRRVRLFDGVRELLKELQNNNIPICLASSSPHTWIRLVVDRFDLGTFFSYLVSSDDVSGRGKPLPDIYLQAVKLLGAKARYCVAIEDSANGVAAAKAAGLVVIGFRNGHNDTQNLSQVDREVRGFSELNLQLLQSLIEPKSSLAF